MAFRDRFFTRQTAEAIMAPSSILLAGAGTAVAVLAGAPVAAAAAVGAAAYAGWVALRMPRARRSPDGPIDPARLRDPWRWYVKEALDSERRYTRAVGGAPFGPIRERLAEIGQRLGDGVAECWRIANRGQELEDALRQLVPAHEVEERIRGLEREAASPTSERLLTSLRAQAASYSRIEQTAAEARDRLQILEARLDEAVARAVELSLRAGDPLELGGLGDDVDALVADMEALRRGLEEASGQAATA